jgi:hypothetical protein
MFVVVPFGLTDKRRLSQRTATAADGLADRRDHGMTDKAAAEAEAGRATAGRWHRTNIVVAAMFRSAILPALSCRLRRIGAGRYALDRGLALDAGVEFGAGEDGKRGQIEPEEKDSDSSERAIGPAGATEYTHVGEGERRRQPDDGAEDPARTKP